MNGLSKKAFSGLAFLVTILALVLLLSAGTVYYWQAWVFLAVFFTSSAAITFYLLKKDTALLQRRLVGGPKAEKEHVQKVIQFFAQISFFAIFLVSALDHRFNWSRLTLYVVIAGDVLVAAGFYIVFRVFKENTYTSAIIEVDKEQKVISSGPYAIVRHPMYSGAFLLLIGTPIALGSGWGLPAFIPIGALIVWRLFDEERFLSNNLPGYTEYCLKVRSRIIPGIF